jgi:hypothetical protein
MNEVVSAACRLDAAGNIFPDAAVMTPMLSNMQNFDKWKPGDLSLAAGAGAGYSTGTEKQEVTQPVA